MVRVLVLDNPFPPHEGLRGRLTAEPGLTVVGQAATGAEAISMSTTLGPDVVLVGSRFPGVDALEVIRRIARPPVPRPLASAHRPAPEEAPPPRVLALAPAADREYALGTLRAGAVALLTDGATPDELVAAVREVAAGNTVLSPDVPRAIVEAVRRKSAVRYDEQLTRLQGLTRRERDVLVAIASGHSNAEIADRLSIAPSTVKTHVGRVMNKIEARTRVQAVTFAYESGLLRAAACG
ncbi:LuxR C-terminal-related transcriptional regulator [Streptomyces pratensis]|uniref:LuxR C-terminal-related transcriptional regulator n=1 Tax=Streptomyces pratensis TaxID=1169025 RepID=UPI00362DEE25